MKFLHTSDWHLGMNIKGTAGYEDDQRFAIENICKIAVDEKVDGILIAGDVFDKSIAVAQAISLYDEITTHICKHLGLPVYIISGNHDSAERLSQHHELLKDAGLYVAGSLSKEPYKINRGDVDIFLLPWISTDKVKSVYPEDAEHIISMEDAYKTVLDKYRAEFVKGHKNILVSHAFIINAETSVSDRAAEVGTATMVGSFVFDGFDYVALGHIHGPQQINKHIRYSGTPMAYSFGKEEKQEKSVTIFDTDSLEQKIIPIKQLRKRVTLSGKYSELISADYDKETENAYVKVVLTDTIITLDIMASFREKFPNLLEISGRSFDRPDETITMTIEEFEDINKDPKAIFIKYCEDVLKTVPDAHQLDLFSSALNNYIEEVTEE
ncbi:MAG: exonuclease SbcCD subunit D [Lachnospiraceae bacterium]|nr:exonuclease SbcCD subunit D [Lachnospiraceae bacterium]